MGVCDTVCMVAERLLEAKMPRDPRHRLQAEILRLMPLYRDIVGLTDWESAFQSVLPEIEDCSEIAELLYEIFEFGRDNMYAAFRAQHTAKYFVELSDRFRRSGIVLDGHQELDGW